MTGAEIFVIILDVAAVIIMAAMFYTWFKY